MQRKEAERRDRVLRALFEGKDWDANDEFMLKRRFVLRSAELLPAYPFLIDDEWDVEPGKTDHGRGDLVFTDGLGGFAVVEIKFIDNERTGRTARTKRTDSRGKVREQALKYARCVARQHHAVHVLACAYTNEGSDSLDMVGCFDPVTVD